MTLLPFHPIHGPADCERYEAQGLDPRVYGNVARLEPRAQTDRGTRNPDDPNGPEAA